MIPSYTEIVDLMKKGMSLEAQEKIMELREAVLSLQEENFTQRSHIETLEKKLTFEASLNFKSPFYFAKDDAAPFCPRCWENDQKAIHLPPPVNIYSGYCQLNELQAKWDMLAER